jgi:hypothetical protein
MDDPCFVEGKRLRFFRPKRQSTSNCVGSVSGALWAVANTLTVFAIRDVGLAIAFPLWNTNCLVGIFWGWLLFNELSIPTNHPVAPKTNCHHHLSFDHGCCVVHEIFEGPRRPGHRT